MKRTPLKPGSGPKRHRRMRVRNTTRLEALFARTYGSAARVEAIQAMPCLVNNDHCGCYVEVAHVKSRGAGGTWRDCVPLCYIHHAEQHLSGVRTFAEKYNVDLEAQAARLAREVLP